MELNAAVKELYSTCFERSVIEPVIIEEVENKYKEKLNYHIDVS